jgi:hypothetical protein
MSVKSVNDLRKSLKSLAREVEQEYDEGDELNDLLFEKVDGWFQSKFSTGRISKMDSYPSTDSEFDRLQSIVNLLKLAEEDAWITEDSGLWEGMDGQQVMFAQAFHSAENVVREYVDVD